MMEGLPFTVMQVIPETKEATTYILERSDGQPVHYQAGQFLTFLFGHPGHEVRRSYSMGSAPGIDDRLYITVKRKENGAISRYILETWRPGTVVHSLPPSGRFTIDTAPHHAREIYFIAAGSGIVPVFSLLKKILREEPLTKITLLYQNHDETSIIYHRQLEQWQQQYPQRFNRIDLLSHPLLHELPSRRLNNGLLEHILSAVEGSTPNKVEGPDLFYTCGPPAFMRMVQFTLRVMGVAEVQLRKENFTIDPIPAPAFSIDPAPRMVTVRVGDKIYRYPVAYPTTILQAALDHHIELPYSCKGGRCATCTATRISGNIKMSINEVLTEKDLQDGLVLTCVGFAETDVELKI